MQGDFQFGSVLGRGFSITIRNLPSFLLICAVVNVPIVLLTMMLQQRILEGETYQSQLPLAMAVVFLGATSWIVITSMLIHGVFQQLRGRPVALGASVRAGLSRLFPVLGVFLIEVVVIGGIAGIMFAVLGAVSIFFLVPFLIIVMTGLWAAVPVAVVEKPGVFASISRSWQLTRGFRLPIFGITLVLWIMAWIVNKATAGVIGAMPGTAAIIIESVVGLFTTALTAVVNAVGYHDLRVAKEGIESGELASVFD